MASKGDDEFNSEPVQPADAADPEPDIFDKIDEAVGQITSADIEARLRDALRKGGFDTCAQARTGPPPAGKATAGQDFARRFEEATLSVARVRYQDLLAKMAEAQEKMAEAQEEAERAQDMADRALNEAAETTASARQRADAIISRARREADTIITQARDLAATYTYLAGRPPRAVSPAADAAVPGPARAAARRRVIAALALNYGEFLAEAAPDAASPATADFEPARIFLAKYAEHLLAQGQEEADPATEDAAVRYADAAKKVHAELEAGVIKLGNTLGGNTLPAGPRIWRALDHKREYASGNVTNASPAAKTEELGTHRLRLPKPWRAGG